MHTLIRIHTDTLTPILSYTCHIYMCIYHEVLYSSEMISSFQPHFIFSTTPYEQSLPTHVRHTHTSSPLFIPCTCRVRLKGKNVSLLSFRNSYVWHLDAKKHERFFQRNRKNICKVYVGYLVDLT